jgi:hypothetical protein
MHITNMERYRNVERLDRALRAFAQLETETPLLAKSSSRGRTKDKRICQLNAAYKYCAHLEQKIKEMCERTDSQVPEDCKLLHTAMSAVNDANDDVNMNEDEAEEEEEEEMAVRRKKPATVEVSSYLTPNQNQNGSIHESSTLSSVATTSKSIASTSTGMMTRSRMQRHLQNSFQLDTSPILGPRPSEVVNDLDELRVRLGSSKRRRVEVSSSATSTASASSSTIDAKQQRKQHTALADLNVLASGFHTPTSVSSCSSDLAAKLEPTRQYFLRSYVNRANSSTASSISHSSTPQQPSQQRNRVKKAVQSKLNSSLASSSSSGSSITTPPSIANTAASSSGGSSSSSSSADVSTSIAAHHSSIGDLESVDARQLLKADSDMTDPQLLSKLFDLNQSDLHRTKNSMTFL